MNLQPFQFPIPEGYEVVNASGNKVHDNLLKDLFLRPIPRERWVVVVERNGSNWVAAIEESEKNAESTQQQSQTIYPTATVSIHKITLP